MGDLGSQSAQGAGLAAEPSQLSAASSAAVVCLSRKRGSPGTSQVLTGSFAALVLLTNALKF